MNKYILKKLHTIYFLKFFSLIKANKPLSLSDGTETCEGV